MSKRSIVGAIACLFVLSASAASAEDAPLPALSDSDLIPINRIEPRFPREALMREISGRVRIAGTVARDGSVLEAHVVVSQPAGVFDRSALRAVRQWKFKPRIKDGQAVEREFEQTINFMLFGPNEPDPLLTFVASDPPAAHELYRSLRGFCPDAYARADDAANAALALDLGSARFVDDLPKTLLFVPQQAEKNAAHIQRAEACLFSSWEQLRDPQAYRMAARMARFDRFVEWGAESATAYESLAAELQGAPVAKPSTPAHLLRVRASIFKRMVPAYFELINAQATLFPPAVATGKTTVDALDRAKAAIGAGNPKSARSILSKALKQAAEPVDRGLLLLALARTEVALDELDAALDSLAEALALEHVPWNVVLTGEMVRTALCGRMGDGACFDASRAKLNAEIGVTDKFKF